jgi:hypothetical protein
MQDPNTGKRILDPVERAKLGMQVINKPLDEALAIVDSFVEGKNYDQTSVNFFKEQVAMQCKIRKEGSELLATGGKIFSLVIGAIGQSIPKSSGPSGNGPSAG